MNGNTPLKLDNDDAMSGIAKDKEEVELSDIVKRRNEDHVDVAQWFLVAAPDVDTDVALLELAADEGQQAEPRGIDERNGYNNDATVSGEARDLQK